MADNHTVYLREKRECVSAGTIRRVNAQTADNYTVYLREKRECACVLHKERHSPLWNFHTLTTLICPV